MNTINMTGFVLLTLLLLLDPNLAFSQAQNCVYKDSCSSTDEAVPQSQAVQRCGSGATSRVRSKPADQIVSRISDFFLGAEAIAQTYGQPRPKACCCSLPPPPPLKGFRPR